MTTFLRPTATKRLIFFIAADLLLSIVTLYFAYLLRFNFQIPNEFLGSFWLVYAIIAFAKTSLLYYMKIYHTVWRFVGFYEAKRILVAHIIAYAFLSFIYIIFPHLFIPFPRSVIVIDAVLSFLVLGGLRFAKRFLMESHGEKPVKPTLIVGSGSRSATIIQNALRGEIDYYPEAILSIDKDTSSHNAYINNIKIYAPEALEELTQKNRFQAAIITQSLPQKELRQLVDRLNSVGIYEIKQAKLLQSEKEKLEDISIEDLLARRPKDLDTETIADFISGKVVMITGAGGSIGSEIALQCKRYGAKKLILLDNGEYNLYKIGEAIPEAKLLLINIADQEAIFETVKDAKPDIIIHAAAYKHVPLCEVNPAEAVKNNVLGSKNIIDAAINYEIRRLVIISTDKAVRPTNVMGATKRVIELYAQNIDSKNTDIVAVRFGNVLGSSGSVIPKFKEQIEAGGPVSVTDPEMTRYFMLIPEACQLVLQAAAIAEGGELFILDMGEPVKIYDLAKQMIVLYGKEDEVEIEIIGLRPGEKLYEELLVSESDIKTSYPSIMVSRPTLIDISKLEKSINSLQHASNIRSALQSIVPEYTPDNKE